MRTPPFYASVVFAVVCSICSSSLFASQEGSKTAQSASAEFYPNTADGLHSRLTELLVAARNDDQGKLGSRIEEMEIPNYENWFTRTFGQEKGQALAGAYGKSLKLSERKFEMLWTELARQEGEISISKVDVANRRFEFAKKDDALTSPTDQFRADWKKTDGSAGPAGQAVGYFYFVDGKFRLGSYPQEVQILTPAKHGPLVSAKLINVVVQKDGTVTVQNVGAGHPLLAPAAVAAVQQWKYDPTTVSGEPVEVQTKVYVTFELTPLSSI